MLGFLFGFNARLGRLHFFLATIAVAVLMTGDLLRHRRTCIPKQSDPQA